MIFSYVTFNHRSIADRLSRRKSRGDNIAPLASSTSKLRHSDVIDDGDDAAPDDEIDGQDNEGDKEGRSPAALYLSKIISI